MTFVTAYRQSRTEVMAFVTINAPATFQQMMDSSVNFVPYVRAYLDDVVVFSKSVHFHLQHLKKVFSLFGKQNVKPKLSKYESAKRSIELLAHT